MSAIHAAKRRVWLCTPYFVPGEAAMMAITSAAQGGLDVRLLVPGASDIPITKAISVTIARGENTGHTFTYSNVVRRWIKLGDWTGKAETYSVPMSDFQNGSIDGAAVLVQTGVASSPKVMLGAAQVAIR